MAIVVISKEMQGQIALASESYVKSTAVIGNQDWDKIKNGDFKAGAHHILINPKDFGLVKISELKDLAELIQDIYDICLCERFETYGFDYNEKHPNRPSANKGSRPKTPRDLVEHRVGFDWHYEKPQGPCKSWKVLRLNGFERKDPS